MRAAERVERNAEALKLFLAGHNYREIGLLQGISAASVERVVKQELAANARRRLMLADEALAIHQERWERLYKVQWDRAEAGDHHAAAICERMLARNARLYGLGEDLNPKPLPAPTPSLPTDDDADEGPTDELARIRAARTGSA